jgi:hypothetical protein
MAGIGCDGWLPFFFSQLEEPACLRRSALAWYMSVAQKHQARSRKAGKVTSSSLPKAAPGFKPRLGMMTRTLQGVVDSADQDKCKSGRTEWFQSRLLWLEFS